MRRIGLKFWHLRKETGLSLMLGVAGLCLAPAVMAEEQAAPAECAPAAVCNVDQVFTDAGCKLSQELERLTRECCAQQCTEDVCAPAEGGCTDGACGETCDTGWCDLGDPWKICDNNDSGFNVGGWTQFGYHNGSTGLFNRHPHRINAHQMWLYAEKVADGSEGLDWGFRSDLVYGVDAQDTQAFGNNPGEWDYQNGWDHGIYGWAMPQLYAEVAYDKLKVKVGHFFTLIGYEVVPATGNFFYSHAFTMYNSEPFTHTGALATYTVSDSLEVYGGWTLGWDTGFDQNNGGSNFLGGFSQALSEDVRFIYITTVGDLGWRGPGYSHSVVLDMALTEKLKYVIQSDLVNANADFVDLGIPKNQVGFLNHSYGLNQYLIYQINDCVAAGTRLEWWKAGGDSQYGWTTGLNVKPHANVIVRPEIRYDWNPGTSFVGYNESEWILGVDAIFTF